MESNWFILLLAATAGSMVSLIGGFILLSRKIDGSRIQRIAVPFAAGALLAAAFFDLIPEAFESGVPAETIAGLMLIGFLIFFILERFLGWFHHHHSPNDEGHRHHSAKSLIVIGDTLHNMIDGLVIGGAFLVDPVVGVVTTMAVAAHEIPQELGDFGVLLAMGMSKKRVVLVNILSALATVAAASLVYAIGGAFAGLEETLLAVTAGLFIYIAAADLIPTIHAEAETRSANIQAVILLFGIAFLGMTTMLAHEYLGHIEGGGETAKVIQTSH